MSVNCFASVPILSTRLPALPRHLFVPGLDVLVSQCVCRLCLPHFQPPLPTPCFLEDLGQSPVSGSLAWHSALRLQLASLLVSAGALNLSGPSLAGWTVSCGSLEGTVACHLPGASGINWLVFKNYVTSHWFCVFWSSSLPPSTYGRWHRQNGMLQCELGHWFRMGRCCWPRLK